jgi:hypothetical protein
VIKKARADGVPKTNIESALQKVCVNLWTYTSWYCDGQSSSYPLTRSFLVLSDWLTDLSALWPAFSTCGFLGAQVAGGKDGAGQLATYEVLAHGSVGLIMYVLYATFFHSLQTALPLARPVRMLTRERECLTDNGNRTLHQIRETLNEHKCVDCPSPLSLSLLFVIAP